MTDKTVLWEVRRFVFSLLEDGKLDAESFGLDFILGHPLDDEL